MALPDARNGRDEMNLAYFPLALLAERTPRGMDTIEYADDYHDPCTGRVIPRKVTISGSPKLGLPTVYDDGVILGLFHLTYLTWEAALARDSGYRPEPRIFFTRQHLLQILRWPDTGQYYNRLKDSLRRWHAVKVTYENWYDNQDGGYSNEKGFTVIDNYDIRDGRRTLSRNNSQLSLALPEEPTPRANCSITWGAVMFNSLQHNNVKPLNLETYFSLETSPARRAYRYRDKDLPGQGQKREYDLHRFACEHVGFSRDYKPSRLRTKVESTIVKPLERAQFIEAMKADQRFSKRDGRLYIAFARKDPPLSLPLAPEAALLAAVPSVDAAAPPFPPAATAANPLLTAELTRRGVSKKVAAQLAQDHPEAYLLAKIDLFDWMVEKKHKSVSGDNPAGFLVAAIRDDYQPPQRYEPKAERERKKQAAEERLKQKQEEAAAKRRQEEQEKAARLAEREHINRILKELGPLELKALEAQALANVDESSRAMAQGSNTIADIMRRTLLEREILRAYPLPAT